MAWCPNCKNEYVDGITHCNDCGAQLVDELVEETVPNNSDPLDQDNYMDKLSDDDIYMEEGAVEGNEELSDTDFENTAVGTDPMNDMPSNVKVSHSYTRLIDKYEDVKSSASTLLIVGIVGAIAMILEIAGVYVFPISEQTKWLFYTVMGGIFIVFIISGIISFMHAKQLKIDADAEEKEIETINTWFNENYTKERIDAAIDTDIQEELLYFNRAEYIKSEIMHQFEETNEDLIDSMIEEIYQNLFE